VRLFFAKIFILISGLCLLGHNIIPHHHHENVVASHHHHDNNDHDEDADHHHHIFSFGHLDDSFILSQIRYDTHWILEFINPNLPFKYVKSDYCYSTTRNIFIDVNESPPPDRYFISATYRGPPIV